MSLMKWNEKKLILHYLLLSPDFERKRMTFGNIEFATYNNAPFCNSTKALFCGGHGLTCMPLGHSVSHAAQK